jgi:hypothetical protein
VVTERPAFILGWRCEAIHRSSVSTALSISPFRVRVAEAFVVVRHADGNARDCIDFDIRTTGDAGAKWGVSHAFNNAQIKSAGRE